MLDEHKDFLSAHALKRCSTRGIRQEMIVKVFDSFDRDVAIGDDCCALSLSGSALAELQKAGMAADEIEGLRRLVVVWSDSSARVVTAFRADRGRQTHRYFRPY